MPTTAPAPPLDDVVAAVAVLRDPALPGTPWTVAQIAAVLPLLAEGLAADRETDGGPASLEAEAWGARMLHAAAGA
jgi:hypothetical protein